MNTSIETKIKALELLLNKFPIHYGEGSVITVRSQPYSNPVRYQVAWFKKDSEVVNNPSEYQDLTLDAIQKFSARFHRVYKIPHLGYSGQVPAEVETFFPVIEVQAHNGDID